MQPAKRATRSWWVFAFNVLAIFVLFCIIFEILGGRLYSGPPRGKAFPIAVAKTRIFAISTALGLFQSDNGFYPGNLQDLVVQPNGLANWHRYFDNIPLDPWGHPYIYNYPGVKGSNSFDLSSAGPDGRAGTVDDIVLPAK